MVLDMIANLRRIQNQGVAETFDQSTDSLEAIANAIAALGFGPGVSLWMFGRCAAAMAPSMTVITTDNLGAVLPDDVFNNEFWMQVIHNTSAPGTAPEREIRRITDFVGATQTFTTDGFTANLEPGDLVAIFHESILPMEILGFGTLDTSSATVPADSTRTEANNYFRGCLLMTTEGAVRFRPTRIVAYTGAGGIFTVDPNNPLPAATGLVDYIIIGSQAEFVPAADGGNSRTPADVIGNKADTPSYDSNDAAVVYSLMRYLRGVHRAKIVLSGVAQAGSDASNIVDAANLVQAAGFWVGQHVLMVSGANMWLSRRIVAFNAATDTITVDSAFPAAVGVGDVWVILSDYDAPVPAADAVTNLFPSDVIGNKADAATLDDMSALATASLVAEVKRILLRLSPAAFSVTIDNGGAARTDLDAILTDLAAMLAGAAGITTWLARAKAGNTVSLAEAIRDIDELKPEWAARTSATHTTVGATEETILTTAYTTPGVFYFNLTLRNLVAGDDFTLRVYKRTDGVNYDLVSEQQFVGNPVLDIYRLEGEYTDGTEFLRVTIQRNGATNRSFPYSYNFLRQPVV